MGLSQEILSNEEITKARVILDHVKASVFFVCDGVVPSNKDRGYVLRRLLRRSMVMAKILNLQATWLKALIGQVIFLYADPYTKLRDETKEFSKLLKRSRKNSRLP